MEENGNEPKFRGDVSVSGNGTKRLPGNGGGGGGGKLVFFPHKLRLCFSGSGVTTNRRFFRNILYPHLACVASIR